STVTNSTISGNIGGSDDEGSGGIKLKRGTLKLINSTVAYNRKFGEYPNGAGINIDYLATFITRNSIIAQNIGLDDVGGIGAIINSEGYNLIGVLFETIDGDTTGNIVGTLQNPVNARLAALAFNGGPTETHALLADSQAINAGNTATSPATDQRGYARNGRADIGAFEFDGSPPTPTPTPTPTVTPTPTITPTPTPTPTPMATPTPTPAAVPTVTKGFSPSSIGQGDSSTVVITLSNSNAFNLTNAYFSDTLTNLTAVGGAVGGTCAGTNPNTLSANLTNLSFSGITIPANSSCTVTFAVTSNTIGDHPNTTSGVSSNQTTAAGAGSNTAVLSVTKKSGAVNILISEFRTRGELGADDEFIELYNNSDKTINIGGFTLRTKEGSGSVNPPTTLAVLDAGATLPARGHYLLRKEGEGIYSLASSAVADQIYTGSLGDDNGIALFASSLMFDSMTMVDAVGFGSVSDPLYKEGTGLTPANGITENGQYSFVRKVTSSGLQDTGNNDADFVLVSNTAGTFSGRVSTLGAPGPENRNSPVSRTSEFGMELIEPNYSSSASPNQARNAAQTSLMEQPNLGTLEFRRRYVNNTGQTVTRLRIRIVDMTTKNSATVYSPQADLRSLSSSDFNVTTSRGALTVKGTVLESPSNLGILGGGLNSSLSVELPGGGLAPGAAINVNFLLGVKQGGRFTFNTIIEALP
ncbi:MAG: choice-of-anchor Q domain-containing protein, partial [Aridibacter sp.]